MDGKTKVVELEFQSFLKTVSFNEVMKDVMKVCENYDELSERLDEQIDSDILVSALRSVSTAFSEVRVMKFKEQDEKMEALASTKSDGKDFKAFEPSVLPQIDKLEHTESDDNTFKVFKTSVQAQIDVLGHEVGGIQGSVH